MTRTFCNLPNKECNQAIVCDFQQKCIYTEMGAKLMDKQDYSKVEFPDGKGYTRNGSPEFYKLLEEMADIHDKKSHDYASNDNPYGNYLFAGMLSHLFSNSEDAGFIGRVGEKLYRLANLENDKKKVLNESIEDTERDIVTIVALWIAMRRERRKSIVKTCEECGHQQLFHNFNKTLKCAFCDCSRIFID